MWRYFLLLMIIALVLFGLGAYDLSRPQPSNSQNHDILLMLSAFPLIVLARLVLEISPLSKKRRIENSSSHTLATHQVDQTRQLPPHTYRFSSSEL